MAERVLDEGKPQGMTPGQVAQLATKRAELRAREPACDASMLLVIDAWNVLGSERAIGWVVGPIPYTAILTWCDRRPYLDAELTTMIADAINTLDADRMRRDAAKSAETKRKGAKGE